MLFLAFIFLVFYIDSILEMYLFYLFYIYITNAFLQDLILFSCLAYFCYFLFL